VELFKEMLLLRILADKKLETLKHRRVYKTTKRARMKPQFRDLVDSVERDLGVSVQRMNHYREVILDALDKCAMESVNIKFSLRAFGIADSRAF